jgi:hypothetical protein
MAFSTAAGAPIAPPSPIPLAPVIDDAAGDSMWCNSIGGISCALQDDWAALSAAHGAGTTTAYYWGDDIGKGN